ncbi:DMT family transporter [Pokkaliibacter sp. CJK22405]|uniref:DMT family transporter n=1 Tax=Pokkaliibacter sp. CJK22405 TaxID=3384615 RepID=UPI003984B157
MHDASTSTTTNLPRLCLTTLLALIAFAANSVLCRLALATESIDAASFTSIRLFSGAVMLSLLCLLTAKRSVANATSPKRSWQQFGSQIGALSLFIYAMAFSLAYVSLPTGAGALILFTSVQMTMLAIAWYQGHRFTLLEMAGLLLAFAGFILLMLPGMVAPSVGGLVLMCLAGMAWGVYTLQGRKSRAPLQDTAGNMLKTLPLAAVVAIAGVLNGHAERSGVVLAIASGALASGVGYALWYSALRSLSAPLAAVLQLSVPLLAAAGGILWMGEVLTPVLMVSGVMTLGGIGLVIFARSRSAH